MGNPCNPMPGSNGQQSDAGIKTGKEAEMKSIEEVLSGEAKSEEPSEPNAEVTQDGNQAGDDQDQARDEQGRFTSKAKEPGEGTKAEGEPGDEDGQSNQGDPDKSDDPDKANANAEEPGKDDPKKTSDKPDDWTYAAYKDKSEQASKWRERAQAAEAQNAEFQRQVQEAQAQQQVPDVYENPEAYNQYWETRLEQDRAEREAFERRMKFETSMQLAHGQHGETFEQAYQEAMTRADNGDESVAFLRESPNPGQALVAWYSREQAAQEIGDDPAAYREKVRHEIEAELREQLQAEQGEQQQDQSQKPVLPSGLAAKRSTASRGGPEWGGPKSLADLLPS